MRVPSFKVTVQLRKRHYSVPLCLFQETLLSVVSWALLFIDLEINGLCGPGQEVSAGFCQSWLNPLQDIKTIHFLGRGLIKHPIYCLFMWS